MGRGGELCFRGTPDDALTFFGAESYDDIYAALDNRPPTEWRRRFEEGESAVLPAEPAEDEAASTRRRGRGRRRRRGRVIPQARVLTGRYVRLFMRDRRNVLILIGQVPILALPSSACSATRCSCAAARRATWSRCCS
jgi:hypothetical protein